VRSNGDYCGRVGSLDTELGSQEVDIRRQEKKFRKVEEGWERGITTWSILYAFLLKICL
jgi:hypothetical protein